MKYIRIFSPMLHEAKKFTFKKISESTRRQMSGSIQLESMIETKSLHDWLKNSAIDESIIAFLSKEKIIL